MSFTLWRGVVGMVRPTRRPGTLEELLRILPEGIGVVPIRIETCDCASAATEWPTRTTPQMATHNIRASGRMALDR